MSETAQHPKWAQPVVDYLGLASFAGAYAITRDLMAASWGLAIGSAVGLIVGFAVLKKLAILPLVTGVTAVVFAALALIFHNSVFIKIKLTIIDGIFAVLLLGGLAMGKAPLKSVLGPALTLSDPAWKALTLRYGLLFAALAIANEIIWRNAHPGGPWGEGTWVAFKVPGVPIIVFLFAIFQAPLIFRELKAHEEAAEAAKDADFPVPPAD
jgi:intracellular septation protein